MKLEGKAHIQAATAADADRLRVENEARATAAAAEGSDRLNA